MLEFLYFRVMLYVRSAWDDGTRADLLGHDCASITFSLLLLLLFWDNCRSFDQQVCVIGLLITLRFLFFESNTIFIETLLLMSLICSFKALLFEPIVTQQLLDCASFFEKIVFVDIFTCFLELFARNLSKVMVWQNNLRRLDLSDYFATLSLPFCN